MLSILVDNPRHGGGDDWRWLPSSSSSLSILQFPLNFKLISRTISRLRCNSIKWESWEKRNFKSQTCVCLNTRKLNFLPRCISKNMSSNFSQKINEIFLCSNWVLKSLWERTWLELLLRCSIGSFLALDCNYFVGLTLDSQEDCIVSHEWPSSECVVRHKAGKSESQVLSRFRWRLEILPHWIGNETFSNSALYVVVLCWLLEEGECNFLIEWPLEECIVVARKYLDEDWHVSRLAWPIAIEENRHLQFVSILTSIKCGTDEFEAFIALRFAHSFLPIGNLPQQRARIICTQFGDCFL